MRILVSTVCYPPAWSGGGAVRAVGSLARSLTEVGAQVRVITTDAFLERANRPPRERDEDGIHVTTLRVPSWCGAGINRFGLAPGFRAALGRELARADVCLAQGVWTWPLWRTARACRKRGVPYVLCAHGSLEQRSLSEKAFKKGLYFRMVEARTLRDASAVLFASAAEREHSASVTAALPAIVVPNALEPQPRQTPPSGRLHRSLGLPRDGRIVGLSGRIHPRKGFDVIVPALAFGNPRIHLAVFGSDDGGYSRTVTRLAEMAGVLDRVHFLGHLDGADLLSTYASLDLLALPSYGESFGNVVLEALAQGTPVMVSAEVPLATYVTEHGFGSVVHELTPDAWRRALDAWVAQAPDFDGARAGLRVRTDFSGAAVGRLCLEALREVVHRRAQTMKEKAGRESAGLENSS